MAIDTPARIAVLGAGPIGLEAALYGRYMGYEVDVFERGTVAQHLLDWGHVRMFSPFGMNRSSLGLAAIRAQDERWQPPAEGELLTGHQLRERYYLPLAETDLLVDSVHTHRRVLAVGRSDLLKGDLIGDEARGDFSFRLLVRDEATGAESLHAADAVIDCTGTYGQPCRLGHGGIPAVGETLLADQLEYGLPDVLGLQRDRYTGRHTVVVGCGYSAANTICALAQLAREAPGTRATWITRKQLAADSVGPLCLHPNDPLAERDALARAANQLANSSGGVVTHWPGTVVERIIGEGEQLRLELVGLHAGAIIADRVVAQVGYRPDTSLFTELQMQLCYATDGPMKLAAALARHPKADCLQQAEEGPQSLVTSEPDFYILGAKSYGRNPHFLLSAGLRQVRQLYSILCDRADLDLYARAVAGSGR